MYGNGSLLACLHPFYTDTSRLARLLGTMLKTTWPDVFTKYNKAFKAGKSVIDGDPGPYIGRVIVYKLQGRLHVDQNDGGPTACFPMGSWQGVKGGKGGELIVPQLGAKFEYVYLFF